MSRPIRAVIDLNALRHNLGVVRRFAPAARVLGVVKANAYGHGVLRVARALAQAGVDGFALLELDAAVALREAGVTQRIVLLEGFLSLTNWPCWRGMASTAQYITLHKFRCWRMRLLVRRSTCC